MWDTLVFYVIKQSFVQKVLRYAQRVVQIGLPMSGF